MIIRQIKFWGCALCDAHGIAEHRTEHTFEGEVPDQNNCDLSAYDDHAVVGGRLLADRPEMPWCRVADVWQGPGALAGAPVGGICHSCLGRDDISRLIPHIRFA